jgi:hypothetical protein
LAPVTEDYPHEQPILLVLPERTTAAEGVLEFLDHPDVLHHAFPPLWFLDAAGVDLPGALPDVEGVTRESLPRVLAEATRLATPEALREHGLRVWRAADEAVRQHYLRRGVLRTFATIFRLAPHSREAEPPPEFWADRTHEHRFEVQYRLARQPQPSEAPAPGEEGSIVYYPFDPSNGSARLEAGLPAGRGPILEVFAYAWQRERHVSLCASVARSPGWKSLDLSR